MLETHHKELRHHLKAAIDTTHLNTKRPYQIPVTGAGECSLSRRRSFVTKFRHEVSSRILNLSFKFKGLVLYTVG